MATIERETQAASSQRGSSVSSLLFRLWEHCAYCVARAHDACELALVVGEAWDVCMASHLRLLVWYN